MVYQGSAPQHKLHSLQAGTRYTLRLQAVNAIGSSCWSQGFSFTTTRLPPLPPSQLQCTLEADPSRSLLRLVPHCYMASAKCCQHPLALGLFKLPVILPLCMHGRHEIIVVRQPGSSECGSGIWVCKHYHNGNPLLEFSWCALLSLRSLHSNKTSSVASCCCLYCNVVNTLACAVCKLVLRVIGLASQLAGKQPLKPALSMLK